MNVRYSTSRLRVDVPRRDRAHRLGFTLLETGLAIIIVGTGVLSIMFAQAAFHKQNEWSTHASTATFLANEIREMMKRLPRHDPVTGLQTWGPEQDELSLQDFDDLDDFDLNDSLGVVFDASDGTGPINAMREVIPNMDGWSQKILVFNIEDSDISAPGDNANDGLTDTLRVEVMVSYQGPNEMSPTEVTRMAWISRR